MKTTIKRIVSAFLTLILIVGMIPFANASAATQTGILLFNYAGNGNYTTTLNSQLSVKYKPNGTDSSRTAYIKNLGWHHARYNNVAYPDDPLYCIEPYRDFAASMGGNSVDRDVTMDGSGSTSGSNVWYALPEARREAIGLILLYTDTMWDDSVSVTTTAKDDNPNVPLRIATQFLIYEIVCGLRNPETFILNSVNECGTSGDIFYNAGVASVPDFASNYNKLVSRVQSAKKLPSFTANSTSSAPTVTLSDKETAVTDSNGVLGNFSFTDGNGVSFHKSGNTLYITQTGAISESTVFSATRSIPSAANSTYNLWYMSNSTYQTTISLASASYGSLNAYFKIKGLPTTGNFTLTKTTEDGNNLSGWQFGLYSDSTCTTLAAGPYTTDTNGKISVSDLSAGTYYVKELGHADNTINALYYCSSTNPQKVTITAGSTASVSFANKLNTGNLSLTKTTEDGKNLSDWQFSIYSNSACTTLVSGPHTTNSTGKISVTGLKPGTYYVKEIGHTDSSINALYYCSSTNPQKITITANSTTSVSFSNELNTGTLNLTKSTDDNKNLEGWQFSIYSDSSCSTLVSGPHTTDSTGRISVTELKPGTYYVKEIGHTDSTTQALYTCASTNPQKVTINSKAITDVSFHNKLSPGSVILLKQTNTGVNLSGWQIGLYTDAACTKAVSGSPFTTGEDGTITVSDLSVGTLYAKEIPVDDPYWVCDPEVKTITIEAGKTATVTFHNTHYGNIRITKNAVNGSAEGWSFQILDAEENTVDTVKSDADGFAYSDMLLPGQYFIREIHDRDDTYWEYDAVVEKEVTVTAGSQAEVMYTNTQYGKIQIQKFMPDGGSLDGWQFSITDASGKEIDGSPFSTNASGLILTGKLQPGEYTVMELIPEDSFYYCTSENPQTITVKAGETAQVSFTNAMRTGSITIEKVDSRGEPLASAKFMLQWSEDGSLWWPIEYSDTLDEGKCSNPNIEDGCLTSGKNGLLEWTDLHPGLYYRVTELEAPKGYTLLSKPAFEGKLPGEELTVSLRVVNCEIFTLPQTGSSAAAFFRISQMLCICVCTILLIHAYRKEHKK